MVEKQAKAFINMNKLLGLILILFAASCEPASEQSPIPNVPVNIEVNLNDIDNAPLNRIGGYIYVDGGVKGIILLRESQNVYRAFDRNCTFQPSNDCVIVDVHSSGFYLVDDCCESTFDLSGFPTGGPAQFPLKEYRISQISDLLLITN
jgi:hypothetical protein